MKEDPFKDLFILFTKQKDFGEDYPVFKPLYLNTPRKPFINGSMREIQTSESKIKMSRRKGMNAYEKQRSRGLEDLD